MKRNFADCELKEYVEQPKFIRLKQDVKRRPVTRSQPQEEPIVQSRIVLGSYYALEHSADDGELVIVKCTAVIDESSFSGVVLQPCAPTGMYEEASQVQTFISDLVHSEVFSAEKVGDGKVSITLSELEEVLSSVYTQ